MSMVELYTGEFVSRDNHRWSVEILGEGGENTTGVQGDSAVADELSFPGEEPLEIEWKATSKEEVICGSTATLRLLSPGDRTYTGLYTIEAGSIMLRVERDGVLYWLGALDPEFYEEPYAYTEDYVVELTFSDFGILERLKYNLSGMQTLRAILTNALQRCRIDETVRTEYISTDVYGATGQDGLLEHVMVRSDNFTDEDGEVSDLKEVIEGIFQPLGLRLVQRNGQVWVYDLNGLYEGASCGVLQWHDDDQMLGVDKVANMVKVAFSPYGESELLSGELKYLGDHDVDHVNTDTSMLPSLKYFSFYHELTDGGQFGVSHQNPSPDDIVDFTIFLGGESIGLAYAGGDYFRIEPVRGNMSSCEGVAWTIAPFHYNMPTGAIPNSGNYQYLHHVGKPENTIVLRSHRVYVPKVFHPERWYLRLIEELLLDGRYNPFTDSSDNNEKACYNSMKVETSWAFVPFSLTLWDAATGGNAIMHFDNSSAALGGDVATDSQNFWVSGVGGFDDAWLCYYSAENPADEAGILGWKENRQCIGRPELHGGDDWRPGGRLTSMPSGQFIPYPSQGGWLEVTVYAGVGCAAWNEEKHWEDPDTVWDYYNLFVRTRWLLYKSPKLEIVRRNMTYSDASTEDVTRKGWLNRSAKDELKIETICGMLRDENPTAKGCYYDARTATPLGSVVRHGRQGLAEQLLIGSLYSQFATRHVKLSGTAFQLTGDLKVYSEAMQDNRRFIILEDVQDVDSGTSEMTAVELSPDEYDGVAVDEE